MHTSRTAGPDDRGICQLRRTRAPRPSPAGHHRSLAIGTSADGDPRRPVSHRLQRRGLQLPRAARRARGRRRTPGDALGHRGPAAPGRAPRPGRAVRRARHVCAGDLGRDRAHAAAGTRPLRHQAAVCGACARARGVCVRSRRARRERSSSIRMSIPLACCRTCGGRACSHRSRGCAASKRFHPARGCGSIPISAKRAARLPTRAGCGWAIRRRPLDPISCGAPGPPSKTASRPISKRTCPVGVFLSGGLDSSALVAAARSRAADLHTYTVVVEEQDFSEAARAEAIARHFNTTHHTLEVTATSIARDWPVLLRHMDQPTADGVNTFYVARAVAADRCEGRVVRRRRRRGVRRLSVVPAAAAGHAHQPHGAAADGRTGRACRRARLARREVAAPGWQRRAPGRSVSRAPRLHHAGRSSIGSLGPRLRDAGDVGASLDHVEQTLMAPAGAESPAATAARLESVVYLRSQLLRDIDSMSMAHSLEVRVPFVDAGLIGSVWPEAGADPESASRQTPARRQPRRPRCPEGIVGHPKQGFTLPFERWLDGPLRDIVRSGPRASVS